MVFDREQKKEIEDILDTFEQAGWEFQIVGWGIEMSDILRGSKESVGCPYRNIPRMIHPEVCKRHREQPDPECDGCERNTNKKLKLAKKPQVPKKEAKKNDQETANVKKEAPTQQCLFSEC